MATAGKIDFANNFVETTEDGNIWLFVNYFSEDESEDGESDNEFNVCEDFDLLYDYLFD